MDERIKRLLYLAEFDNKKDKKVIKESVDILFESKQTEQQAAAILKNVGDERLIQDLLNKFKSADTSKNQVLLPTMAKSYLEVGNRGLNELLVLFKTVSEMMNANKINAPQVTETGYVVGGKTFKNYLGFAQYIHGLEGMSKGHAEWKGKINTDVDEPPIFPDESKGDRTDTGIEIYDGNDIGKCIKYSTGGLTGKHYNFCIGQPANTMWQSYRDSQVSTFYYLIDKSRELDDPLHIVVIDMTSQGVQLTDANNATVGPFAPHGSIAEFGTDVGAYMEYIRKRGVPIDRLINSEKTPDEEAEQEKLGSRNLNLGWFKKLSYEEKSKYIGRGHLLSDEQFNYLWDFKNDKGGYHLLHQYVDTGQAIPEEQFNILVSD
jgi:hypothetical protein